MVYTKAVAEHTAQPFHHLHGERNLGKQVEHLAMLLYLALNQMDVYLGLSAGGDTVEQGDVFLQEREQNLVVGILLDGTERVQPSHFHLVGLKHATLHQLVQNGHCGGRMVDKLVATHQSNQFRLFSLLSPLSTLLFSLSSLLSPLSTINQIPPRHL